MRHVFAYRLLSLLLLAAPLAPGAAAQVFVIGHPSVPVQSVEKQELLDIFTGDRLSWESGRDVVVVDLAQKGPVRDSFYDYLGTTSSRMKSIWLKRKLTGRGEPPERFETEDEVVRRVRTTPGAVGYVSYQVDLSGVKVLARIPLVNG